MSRSELWSVGVLSVIVVLTLGSTAGLAAADHAHGEAAEDPPLRELVRGLGDGTVAGPTMDALASLGPDAVWRQVGLLTVGVGGILLLAFGPAAALVAFHWTYRRLRWLFRAAVGAVRRGATATGAVLVGAGRRLVGSGSRSPTGADRSGAPAESDRDGSAGRASVEPSRTDTGRAD